MPSAEDGILSSPGRCMAANALRGLARSMRRRNAGVRQRRERRKRQSALHTGSGARRLCAWSLPRGVARHAGRRLFARLEFWDPVRLAALTHLQCIASQDARGAMPTCGAPASPRELRKNVHMRRQTRRCAASCDGARVYHASAPAAGIAAKAASTPAASTPSAASATVTDGTRALGCALPRRASAACNGTATASVPAASSASYAACKWSADAAA